MTREIPLFSGRGIVLVDEADFTELSKWRWTLMRSRHHHIGYATSRIGRATTLMHRLLMKPPPGLIVDHVNGDTLDNRRCNLRVCTVSQNAAAGQNRNLRRARSGFKGVYLGDGARFVARLRVDGRLKNLGSFPTALSAAHAHDKASSEHHGAFARLNFRDVAAP